jgi:hypothetical protein
MPKYKDPYEKGRLIIQFKVNFPKPGFATPEQLAQLEKLLPPRQPLPMQSPEAEERVLEDFDIERLQREQQVCCCVAFFEHVSSFSFSFFTRCRSTYTNLTPLASDANLTPLAVSQPRSGV